MNGPSRDGNIVFLGYREEAQRKIRCVLCFGHFATLCLISQPMEWGANGEVLDKCLCLQQRRLGTSGEESCKSFRNGDRGGGRVSRAPQISACYEIGKANFTT